MASLSIDAQHTVFDSGKRSETENIIGRDTPTSVVLGNIVCMLEDEFPDHSPEACGARLLEAFGTSNAPKIWGFREYGNSLLNINNFLGDASVRRLTRKDAEYYCDKFGLSSVPVSIERMYFRNIGSVDQVLAAILYFYAQNGYMLAKCAHCQKWFATKTRKEKYCIRTSPCVGTLLSTKQSSKRITCKLGVQRVRQKCQQKYRRIDNTIGNCAKGGNDIALDFRYLFQKEYFRLKESCSTSPTLENLQAWSKFLDETEEEKAWTHHFSSRQSLPHFLPKTQYNAVT